MIKKAYASLRLLFNCRYFLSFKLKVILSETLVLSHFNFCDVVYNKCITQINSSRIQKLQNACIRLIFGARKYDHISHFFEEISWLKMHERRNLHSLIFYHKVLCSNTPRYLREKIKFRSEMRPRAGLRTDDLLHMPKHKTAFFESSFIYNIVKSYNKLLEIDRGFRNMTLSTFKRKIIDLGLYS